MVEYPSDWKVARLGEVMTDAAYGVGAEAVTYNHEVKYIRITDIDDDSHRFIPNPITSPAFYEQKHIVVANDILVARTGATVGKAYLYDDADGKLAYAGFLMKFNVIDADARYVFLQTLTKRYRDWVLAESMRTGQPGLNLEQLKSFSIPLPPLPEQKRIAKVLDDVDRLIENLGKRIAKKRLIKKGIAQELLTGKKRLPGFEGEPPSPNGSAVPGWKTVKLGDVADIRTGKRNGEEQKEDGLYPFFVRSQEVHRIDSYSFDGEAIIVPGEGGIGSIFHYINGKFDYHQRVYKISDFPESICCKYVYFYMRHFFGKYALRNTVKATVDSLRLPTFEQFVVFLPPLPEQRAIAKVLSDMDAEIANLEARQAKLKLVKKGMLQDLLTGKVRLK